MSNLMKLYFMLGGWCRENKKQEQMESMRKNVAEYVNSNPSFVTLFEILFETMAPSGTLRDSFIFRIANMKQHKATAMIDQEHEAIVSCSS
jgi:hypothetical protein